MRQIGFKLFSFASQIVMLACCLDLQSETIGFLPGDVFFASLINEDSSLVVDDSTLGFDAGSAGFFGYFGPSVGFTRLTLKCDSNTVANRLLEGMRAVRKARPRFDRQVMEEQDLDGNVISRHLNAFLCIFYSKDFDTLRHPIGLRANCNWTVLNKKFGTSILYNCEWASQDATIEDWRLAGGLPTLPAVLKSEADFLRPITRGSSEHQDAHRVIATSFKDVRIVLVPSIFFRNDFALYFDTLSSSRTLLKEWHRITALEDGTDRDTELSIFLDHANEIAEQMSTHSWVELTEAETRLVTIGAGLPEFEVVHSSPEEEPSTDKSEE